MFTLKIVVSVFMTVYMAVVFTMLYLNLKHRELSSIPMRRWSRWLRLKRKLVTKPPDVIDLTVEAFHKDQERHGVL